MSLNIDIDITQAYKELEELIAVRGSLKDILNDYTSIGNSMKKNWTGENAELFFNKYDEYCKRLEEADIDFDKLIKDIKKTIEYIIETEKENVDIVENSRR